MAPCVLSAVTSGAVRRELVPRVCLAISVHQVLQLRPAPWQALLSRLQIKSHRALHAGECPLATSPAWPPLSRCCSTLLMPSCQLQLCHLAACLPAPHPSLMPQICIILQRLQCTSNPVHSGCLACRNNGACKTCADGYAPVDKRCRKCTVKNCLKCAASPGVCTACVARYRLVKGLCQPATG